MNTQKLILCVAAATVSLLGLSVPSLSRAQTGQQIFDPQLQALPAIPDDILKHLPKRVRDVDLKVCEADAGTQYPLPQQASSCVQFTQALNDQRRDAVLGKHQNMALADEITQLDRPFLARQCSFGDSGGCFMYASSVESSQPEIAAHVYGLKTCQDDTFCSSHGHSMDAYLASRSSQTSKFATVMGAINDTLAPITANADPNGIQDAANRGVNNINSVTAHNQEVRAREYKPAVTITPSTGQSVAHSATATSSVGTGNAPPPNCVYLSPSQPCVPLAQYAQMQAQQQASGQGICPASGFVPGVMLRVESDVGK